MGKLGILVIGIVLIIGVLFIGYKMDTSSPKAPAKKSPKKQKTKAKREKAVDDDEEIYNNVYNMNYELNDDDEDEYYEEEYISDDDVYEEEEDEEAGFFSGSVEEDEPTFDIDIDNELSFETSTTNDYIDADVQAPVQNDYNFYEDISVDMPDDEEVVVEDIAGNIIEEPISEPVVEIEEEPEVVVEPPKKKRGRPKKVAEPIVEEVAQPEPVEDDFSSTMIFDTDKLTSELEEIDSMDNMKVDSGLDSRLDIFGAFGKTAPEPPAPAPVAKPEPVVEPKPVVPVVEELTPEDYSDAVNIDAEIDSLDDDMPKVSAPAQAVEGPFKPAENEAESFMNELKRMQETAEADDFEGFAVDTRSEDLKEVHKKYTKKKPDPMMDNSQISFIPEEKKEEPVDSGLDIHFLAEMEKNLKETQKQRMTKKTTKKKDEE